MDSKLYVHLHTYLYSAFYVKNIEMKLFQEVLTGQCMSALYSLAEVTYSVSRLHIISVLQEIIYMID